MQNIKDKSNGRLDITLYTRPGHGDDLAGDPRCLRRANLTRANLTKAPGRKGNGATTGEFRERDWKPPSWGTFVIGEVLTRRMLRRTIGLAL